jgi:8-oxo-dGTP pyrophosphatase MutT (NUDIX family)
MHIVSLRAVLFTPDGKVLLLSDRDEWDLPGGRIEPGESSYDCLVREVKEELNLDVEVGRLVHAHQFEDVSGHYVFVVTYHCSVIGSFTPKLSPEHHGIEYFAPEQLPQNLAIGFRAAITLAARTSAL